MTFSAIISLIIAIVPMITELIKWAEGKEAPGPDKKNIVLTLFEGLWDTLSNSGLLKGDLRDVPKESAVKVADVVIDAVVTTLNTTGVFQHQAIDSGD